MSRLFTAAAYSCTSMLNAGPCWVEAEGVLPRNSIMMSIISGTLCTCKIHAAALSRKAEQMHSYTIITNITNHISPDQRHHPQLLPLLHANRQPTTNSGKCQAHTRSPPSSTPILKCQSTMEEKIALQMRSSSNCNTCIA